LPGRVLLLSMPLYFIKEFARAELVFAAIDGAGRILAPLFARALFVVHHCRGGACPRPCPRPYVACAERAGTSPAPRGRNTDQSPAAHFVSRCDVRSPLGAAQRPVSCATR